MKKLIVTGLSLLLVVSIVITACKKKKDDDDQPTPAGPTKTEILSSNVWKVTDVIANGTSVWNFPGVFQACDKDDTYKFWPAKTMTDYDLPTKCNSGDPDTLSSAWTFHDNETKLIIDLKKFSIKDTGEILELTSTKLRLKVNYQGTEAEAVFQPK